MSIGVRAPKHLAEAVRQHLVSFDLIAFGKRIKQESHEGIQCVVFPVKNTIHAGQVEAYQQDGVEIVEYEHVVPDNFAWSSLEKNLEGVLSAKESECLIKSFDVIGDIVAIEIPDALKEKEGNIAQAILRMKPNIRVVCKKTGAHTGDYRVQRVTVIGGENRTETEYHESGVKMKFDIGKAWFSPRLTNDRMIIARQVKAGEVVGALFGGVGPFALVIAKNQPGVKRVFSIELNPDAHTYAQTNIILNKFQDRVEAVLMDARIACETVIRGICDRVCMPTPKEVEGDFLVPAFEALKPEGGVIHFYQFTPEKDPFSDPIRMFNEAAEKAGKRVEILDKRTVGRVAPLVMRVCVDARIY